MISDKSGDKGNKGELLITINRKKVAPFHYLSIYESNKITAVRNVFEDIRDPGFICKKGREKEVEIKDFKKNEWRIKYSTEDKAKEFVDLIAKIKTGPVPLTIPSVTPSTTNQPASSGSSSATTSSASAIPAPKVSAAPTTKPVDASADAERRKKTPEEKKKLIEERRKAEEERRQAADKKQMSIQKNIEELEGQLAELVKQEEARRAEYETKREERLAERERERELRRQAMVDELNSIISEAVINDFIETHKSANGQALLSAFSSTNFGSPSASQYPSPSETPVSVSEEGEREGENEEYEQGENFIDAEKILEDMKQNEKELEKQEQQQPEIVKEARRFKKRLSTHIQESLMRLSEEDRIKRVPVTVKRDELIESSCKAFTGWSKEELMLDIQVEFEGESGLDVGGLTREWFAQIIPAMTSDENGLFYHNAEETNNLLMVKKHAYKNQKKLIQYVYLGIFLAKALMMGVVVGVRFHRAVLLALLGRPVTREDVKIMDPELEKRFEMIEESDVSDLCLTFSIAIKNNGKIKTVDLVENGSEVEVTNENKKEYIEKYIQEKYTNSIRKAAATLHSGISELIPEEVMGNISVDAFELLLSGSYEIDVDDWQKHTTVTTYKPTDNVIVWFFDILREMDNSNRQRFLHFCTGSSFLPPGGFAFLEATAGQVRTFEIRPPEGKMEKMSNGKIAYPLPVAHTCFNIIDLPNYPTKEMMREKMNMALECDTEGFGLE